CWTPRLGAREGSVGTNWSTRGLRPMPVQYRLVAMKLSPEASHPSSRSPVLAILRRPVSSGGHGANSPGAAPSGLPIVAFAWRGASRSVSNPTEFYPNRRVHRRRVRTRSYEDHGPAGGSFPRAASGVPERGGDPR